MRQSVIGNTLDQWGKIRKLSARLARFFSNYNLPCHHEKCKPPADDEEGALKEKIGLADDARCLTERPPARLKESHPCADGELSGTEACIQHRLFPVPIARR